MQVRFTSLRIARRANIAPELDRGSLDLSVTYGRLHGAYLT